MWAVLNTTFRSLNTRNYRLFATGQLVKLVGVWMMFTAQDWLVLELSDNSPGALGMVTALQFVPVMVLTLWSGRLADRYDKRKLLIAANAAFAAFAIAFAVLLTSGVVVLWHVFVFALLLGIANAVETPVRQAFVSELVEMRLLPNALALSAATFNVARISGPAVAGVLLAVLSTPGVFLISTVVNGVELGLPANLFATFIMVGVLLWAAMNVMADQRAMKMVLLCLVFACAVRAGIQVLGIGVKTYNVYTGGQRVTALGQNLNLSAIIFSAGLVTLVGLRLQHAARQIWLHVIAWPVAAVIAYAAIQTGSRGGVVCGVAGVLVLLIGAKARLGTVFLAIVTVAALGVGISRSETLTKRFLSAEEGKLSGRERIYPAAVEMIKERPVLGWGPADNQFELARRIDERKRPSRDMHNLLLEVWTVSGVIGAIPFLVGLGLCFGAAWAARGGPRTSIPIGLVAAITPGIVSGTWIASKILWLVLAIAIASGQAGTRYVAVVPEE